MTMRDASLRWGLMMGAVAAGIGAAAQLLGAIFGPLPTSTTADAVLLALIFQTFFALLALGIAFGIAYYAGMRAERDRQRAAQAEGEDARIDRSGSVLAGGVVAICYWFVTTLMLYIAPPTHQSADHQLDLRTFLTSRLIFGVCMVLLAAGFGGLGGRAVAARQLLQSVVKPAERVPFAPMAPVAPVVTPAESIASPSTSTATTPATPSTPAPQSPAEMPAE